MLNVITNAFTKHAYLMSFRIHFDGSSLFLVSLHDKEHQTEIQTQKDLNWSNETQKAVNNASLEKHH